MRRYSAVLLASFCLIILRIPALVYPVLDVDEAIYGLFARIWFDGGIPYLDCVETKPLGIYFFYGLIFSIFGKFNMIAVHSVTICIVGLTAYVIYLIAQITNDESLTTNDERRTTGFWAALFYIIFSTTYIPKYIATTIEPVMLLFVAIQFYLWLKFDQEGKSSFALLSGLAFSAACLFKYQAGMNLIILLAYLVFVRKSLRGLPKFILGALPLPLIMLAYLAHAGALGSFIFWSVEGNAEYIGGGSRTISLIHQLLVRVLPYITSTLLLWILAGIYAVKNARRATRQEWLIILWFMLSIIPVSMGLRFYGHYFLLLLPPLCILAAPVAAKAWGDQSHKWKKFFIAFAMILPAAGFTIARFNMARIHTAVGEDNLENYKPIAAYIKNNTSENNHIVVWGFAPLIYWYSERLPATRFFWSDLLAGRVPGSRQKRQDHEKYIMPEAWNMFMADIERNKPTYFIDTSPAGLHDYENFPIADYPLLNQYLQQNYREEAKIEKSILYKRLD